MEEAHHHVHFDAEVINDKLHDNTIIYQTSPGSNTITVHLGFLQIKHRYRIELNIPEAVVQGAGFHVAEEVKVEDAKVPNINCKLLEFSTKAVDKCHRVAVEFFAHKEKLLKEQLTVCGSEDGSVKVTIVLVARVLGRGKGTPMLRDGIHLIAVEDDAESELSDWQGFPKKE